MRFSLIFSGLSKSTNTAYISFVCMLLKSSKPGELDHKNIVSTDQDLRLLLKIYIKIENWVIDKKTFYYVDADIGCGQVCD